jgi:ribose transport system substrate-binding protein
MKKLITVLLVICAVLALIGCAKSAEAAPAAQTSAPANDRSDQLYIEVSAFGNLAYFYDHKMGMQKVGEELGVKTEYVGPADGDMSAMVSAFEQAIAKKPQGLVVVGFEPSLNSIVDKAVDSGIPVVTVDADLPGSKRLAFVGTGNKNAGITGAEYLAKILDGKGKVAILTRPGQSNLEERLAGYQEALAKYPGIQIVQVGDTQSDSGVAASVTSALLQRHPDLAGIACVEAAGGAGAATAVKEAGLQSKVKIISMDRDNEVVAAIEEGTITASVAQQTALMPYYATQILYNLVNSKVDISTDNKAAGVAGVPQVVDTGSIIVDANNARYFKR